MSFLIKTIGAFSVLGCVATSNMPAQANQDEAMSQETVLGMCNNYCASLTKIVDELPESSATTVHSYNMRTNDENIILQWLSIARGLTAESEQLILNVVGPLVVYANASSTSAQTLSSLNEVYQFGMSNIRDKLSIAQLIVGELQHTTPFRYPNLTDGLMSEKEHWNLLTPEGRSRAAQNVVDADHPASLATLLRCAGRGVDYMLFTLKGEPKVPLALDDYCWDLIKPLNTASGDPSAVDKADQVSEASVDAL
jgi:hypothetical protein